MFRVRFACFLAGIVFSAAKKSPIASSLGKVRSMGVKIMPKGDNQKVYFDCLKNKNISIVAGLGPAGCGKTLFACHAAIETLVSGECDKIVITRPLVSADEDLGFLPGSISQKMDPWVRPIFDILEDFFTPTQVRDMMNAKTIEISPLGYMRGRTFKRSFVIADEMQNSTPNQMLMMLTRIGDGSKLAVTGDLMQSDLKIGSMNGLDDFVRRYKKSQMYNNDNDNDNDNGLIRIVEMGSGDVRRSPAVAKVLDIYNFSLSEKKVTLDIQGQQLPMKTSAAVTVDIQINPLANKTSVECVSFSEKHNRDDNKDSALIPKKHYAISIPHIVYSH